MLFKSLELDPKLMKAVEVCGFTEATEIQQQAIPVVLQGRDLMASAQTGTGKTAAFVLPALQRLLQPSAAKGCGPRVLVLTPTRELAMQVNDNIRQFSRFAKFVNGTVVGGMPYPPQIRMLRQPLDLLVATPGRLMDHMEQGRVDFSRIEMLILDEADRMLDMGFVDAVKQIAAATPASRQTLLFSATLEGRVSQVAKSLLKDPARIQLAANHEHHASIAQRVHRADDVSHKHRLLSHYINSNELTQAVIFTATKRGAEQLARRLADEGHKAAALHGDMTQGARKRTVKHMHHGNTRLLVATDVAARGLDIKGISHVINFDLPMVAEDYIHRIGRTGRGGATGTAVSFVGPDCRRKLFGIERLTGKRLDKEEISGLEPRTPEPRGPGKAGPGRKAAPRRGKPAGGFGNKRPARGRGDSANGRNEGYGRGATGGAARGDYAGGAARREDSRGYAGARGGARTDASGPQGGQRRNANGQKPRGKLSLGGKSGGGQGRQGARGSDERPAQNRQRRSHYRSQSVQG